MMDHLSLLAIPKAMWQCSIAKQGPRNATMPCTRTRCFRFNLHKIISIFYHWVLIKFYARHLSKHQPKIQNYKVSKLILTNNSYTDPNGNAMTNTFCLYQDYVMTGGYDCAIRVYKYWKLNLFKSVKNLLLL